MTQPAVAWFEVTGKNGPGLQAFYTKLFDWELTDAGSGYGLVATGEGGISGGIGQAADGSDGGAMFYVEVDDPAAYLQRVESLGGTVVVPPTELPDFGLTFAFFADPEGHVVGLSKGARQ
jgi:predicted enzyme related to lactoylglutathione lyase